MPLCGRAPHSAMARSLTGASRTLGHGTEMVQHTPGPWVAREVPKMKIIGIAERGMMHPHAYIEAARDDELTDTDRANASLIAAAPDLLAALREMLDVQSRRQHPLGLPNEGISGDAASAASNARAAITKAEG